MQTLNSKHLPESLRKAIAAGTEGQLVALTPMCNELGLNPITQRRRAADNPLFDSKLVTREEMGSSERCCVFH